MNGKAQQEPPAVQRAVQIEIDAHALPVIRGDVPAGGEGRVIHHFFDGGTARRAEILGGDVQADFGAFHRLPQIGDEIGQLPALLL